MSERNSPLMQRCWNPSPIISGIFYSFKGGPRARDSKKSNNTAAPSVFKSKWTFFIIKRLIKISTWLIVNECRRMKAEARIFFLKFKNKIAKYVLFWIGNFLNNRSMGKGDEGWKVLAQNLKFFSSGSEEALWSGIWTDEYKLWTNLI